MHKFCSDQITKVLSVPVYCSVLFPGLLKSNYRLLAYGLKMTNRFPNFLSLFLLAIFLAGIFSACLKFADEIPSSKTLYLRILHSLRDTELFCVRPWLSKAVGTTSRPNPEGHEKSSLRTFELTWILYIESKFLICCLRFVFDTIGTKFFFIFSLVICSCTDFYRFNTS